jgi:hypothetical protein
VSPALNWAVVSGQRCTRDDSSDWLCPRPALKSNVLTCRTLYFGSGPAVGALALGAKLGQGVVDVDGVPQHSVS